MRTESNPAVAAFSSGGISRSVRVVVLLSVFAPLVVRIAAGQEALPRDGATLTAREPIAKTEVTAARLPAEKVALQKYPGHVTIVTRDEIAASPAMNAAELLRQRAGLLPVDTVGFGQFANIAARGFGDKTGLLILVDGMRVNDAGSSEFPFLWTSIPLDNIERIEIVRGGASMVYGEGAVAGVINIITKSAGKKPVEFSVTGAGGNLGYYSVHGELSGRQQRFEYFASAHRQEWDGWRQFSAFRRWSAILKPALDTAAGKFTVAYYFHDEHSENPGNLTQAQFDSDPRQVGGFPTVFDNEIHRFSLDYAKSFDNGWSVLAKAFGQLFDQVSTSAFGVSRVEQPNCGLTVQVSCNAKAGYRDNLFSVGAEAIQQDFVSTFTSAFGVSTTGADNWTASVFVNDTLDLTPNLSATAGLRFDHREWNIAVLSDPPSPWFPDILADREANVWSAKVGLIGRPAENVSLWLTGSRSFRLPSGFDIGAAGQAPGQLFYANPDIDPVEARTVEVGARYKASAWLGGSVAYYYSNVRNDILYNPFTWTNENFNSIRQGVELALNSQPAEFVDGYFTAAWTDAHFDGGSFDGKRLPLVAEWQLTGGVNVRPVRGLQLTLEIVHVRGQIATNDFNNIFGRNDYTVANARAAYQWRNVSVFAAVNNLLDELYEAYPASNGAPGTRRFNPAPGINFQVGGAVRF